MSFCYRLKWHGGGNTENENSTSTSTSPESLKNTTWFWQNTDSDSDTCTNEHYSSGTSGGNTSTNTCENYSVSKIEVSRTTKTVNQTVTTYKNYYLHIDSDSNAYLGTYSYKYTVPSYSYDEVTYKVTYACNDGIHNLTSWNGNVIETENSTKVDPIIGNPESFTPIYQGTLNINGNKASFSFNYDYETSANKEYWGPISSVGTDATTTYLYSDSTSAYDLSVSKSSSLLKLIYSSGTSKCNQKLDAIGTLCSNTLSYQNYGKWTSATYNEDMIGPERPTKELYEILKKANTKFYYYPSSGLSLGSQAPIISFKDKFTYTRNSASKYCGGDYWYIPSSSEADLQWSASPDGKLVLKYESGLNYTSTSTIYDILYKNNKTNEYQLYFNGSLYPSSDYDVSIAGIGKWSDSYLENFGTSYGDVTVNETSVNYNFTFTYKPFDTDYPNAVTITSTIYNDKDKFEGNTYQHKKDYVQGQPWYKQAAIWRKDVSDTNSFSLYISGLKLRNSISSMQEYTIFDGNVLSYTVQNVAELENNKYIISASASYASSSSYISYILTDNLNGTLTLVPTESDSSSENNEITLTYASRYGYSADDYVTITFTAKDDIFNDTLSNIIKNVFANYDYTISDSSITANALKTTTIQNLLEWVKEYSALKKGYNIIAKTSSTGDEISSTETVENKTSIYFDSQKNEDYINVTISCDQTYFSKLSSAIESNFSDYEITISEENSTITIFMDKNKYISTLTDNIYLGYGYDVEVKESSESEDTIGGNDTFENHTSIYLAVEKNQYADNYVELTIYGSQDVIDLIIKTNSSSFYTKTDSSITIALKKNTYLRDIISYDFLKVGYNLVIKDGSTSSAQEISSTNETVEKYKEKSLYCELEKDSSAFIATYTTTESDLSFIDCSAYEYELSSDAKTIKILVIPSNTVSIITSFINYDYQNEINKNSKVFKYTYANSSSDYGYKSFKDLKITSDTTITLSVEDIPS